MEKKKASSNRAPVRRALKSGDSLAQREFTQASRRPAHRLILIVIAAFLTLRVFATLLIPLEIRLWGINFGGFLLPDADVLLALFLPFIFLLPAIQVHAGSGLKRLFETGNKPWFGLSAAAILLAAIAWTTWSVQVRFPLLGDGSYYLAEVTRILNTPGYESVLFKPTSYLTAHVITTLAHVMSPDDGREIYRLLGTLSAVALSSGALFLLRRESPVARFSFAAFLLLSSGSLFFFGYVELYVLQYATALLYMLAGWSCLRNHASIAAPVVFFLLTVGFGGSSAIFLPSLLMLFFFRYAGDGRPRIGAFVMAAQALLVLAGLFTLNAHREHPFLIPVSGGESWSLATGTHMFTNYSLFSAAHLLDLLNILLLNGGVLAAALVALLPLVLRDPEKDRSTLFGMHAAFSGALLLVFGHASFGLARDWDLAAVPAAGVLFYAGAALARMHERGALRLELVLPALLATAASSVYLWVALNADERSIARMETLVTQNDGIIFPQATFQGYEHLRKFYHHQGAEAEHLRIVRKMAETGHMKLEQYRIHLALLERIRDTNLLRGESDWLLSSVLRDAHEIKQKNRWDYIDPAVLREFAATAVVTFHWAGRVGIAAEFSRRMNVELPSWREGGFAGAVIDTTMPKAKRIELANASLSNTIKDPLLAAQAGRFYARLEEYDRATAMYERSLELDGERYPYVYPSLAAIYEVYHRDPMKSLKTLETCYERCYLYSDRPRIKRLIESMKRHYGL